ncbi:MAG: hypothetical protein IKD41_00955 [Alistipes sp.]|nr:hypothetical protein [Alistipes sp.]
MLGKKIPTALRLYLAPICRQSATGTVYREKSLDRTYFSVFPIQGFEGCAVDVVL